MENSAFTSALITWYREHHRDLPWRQTRDPYKIWLSEVILQQTRVSQGLPYYQAFCRSFPKVSDLARASEQEVLRLWQGLGYYSRARNLHRCAQLIVKEYQGQFPRTYRELISLPGIGDYTASAIASFAYKQATPVVDGNVFRVLSRIFGVRDDIAIPNTRAIFKTLSAELMKHAPADQFNQAIMEFGALQCTPKRPQCSDCPLSTTCYAFANNLQHQFPVKTKKMSARKRYFYYYVLKSGSQLWLKKRTRKDIWQGLYDFMLLESDSKSDPVDLLAYHMPNPSMMNQMIIGEPSVEYLHKLTHQHINARFLVIEASSEAAFDGWQQDYELQAYSRSEVHKLPKPILIDNYLKADIF